MNEIINELESAPQKRGLSSFWVSLVAVGVAIVVFGFYIGNLMFGANSLEILIRLDTKERFLKERIAELQQTNADLQKEYFELKELEADVR